ncbi:hypothetical protein BJV82DRAFT_578414 [Fennellomyces sp. T-0311]|nr:hypothetical protein BJV82DRAFT_578414 [Fennellomyces sp. T-0311]
MRVESMNSVRVPAAKFLSRCPRFNGSIFQQRYANYITLLASYLETAESMTGIMLSASLSRGSMFWFKDHANVKLIIQLLLVAYILKKDLDIYVYWILIIRKEEDVGQVVDAALGSSVIMHFAMMKSVEDAELFADGRILYLLLQLMVNVLCVTVALPLAPSAKMPA